MNATLIIFVLLLGLGLSSAGIFSHWKHEVKKIKLPKINIGNDLAKLTGIGGKELHSIEAVGLSWKDCGSSSDVIQINKLTIGPEPLRLPGQIQVSFDVKVKQNISSSVSIDLDINVKKNPIGWIHVPCIDHVGSCTYGNVCPDHRGRDCPAVFDQYHIPCQCPISQGQYDLPLVNIDVDDVSIPSFLKNGEFKVRAKGKMANLQLFCVNMEFSLK